jgi:hypothetical protein
MNQKFLIIINLFVLCSQPNTFSGPLQDKTPSAETKSKSEKQPASTPSVDEILKRYLEAIGGRSVVEKLQSQVAKGGTFDSGVAQGSSVAFYKKAPNKWLFASFDASGAVTFQQGDNGTVRWTKNSDEVSAGDSIQAEQHVFQLKRALTWKVLFPKMEFKRTEKIGQSDAFIIEAFPAEGKPTELTFDARTGLLIREAWSESGSELDHEYRYEDYRDVDGLKVPFNIRCVGSDNWTLQFKEVKNNVPIDDAKFEKPFEK